MSLERPISAVHLLRSTLYFLERCRYPKQSSINMKALIEQMRVTLCELERDEFLLNTEVQEEPEPMEF